MHRLSEKAVLFAPPSTIEPEALKQVANTAVDAVRLQARRRDARLSLRQGRHGRYGAGDQRLDHSGGRGRRHRLRDDCRPDAAEARRHHGPCGRSIGHRAPHPHERRPQQPNASPRAPPRASKELESLARRDYSEIDQNWKLQLGTLGGGNHFIELATDESGTVWATLHSGSRGIGNKIGNLYIRRAQALAKEKGIKLPDRDLAFLNEGTQRLRRLHPRSAVGAAVRASQSRRDDGPRHDGDQPARLRRSRSRRRARRPAHQLPPQLHAGRRALRRAGVGDAQGRHRGPPRDVGDDSRVDGHAQLHRDGAGTSHGLPLGAARRGPPDVAHGRAAAVHDGRSRDGHARDRVPRARRYCSTRFPRPTRTSTR